MQEFINITIPFNWHNCRNRWQMERGQMGKIEGQIRKIKEEEGFTLLEIIVAVSILAIGLLAVASMQIAAIQGNSLANKLTEGTNLAQARLEDLMAMQYTTGFTDPGLTQGNYTDTSLSDYTITWNVTNNNPVPTAKRIVVTVTWAEKGATKRVTLNSFKARS